jgi:DNA/RNA-binding domain of Phe-tRNA-synthetase-like protein
MMPTYTIDARVFELFPEFRRCVILASGIENYGTDSELSDLLRQAVSSAPNSIDQSRIDAWNGAFQRCGVDPERYTPSVRFLHQQIRKGKPVRSINKIVDVMNITSLRWCVPAGGDDLHSMDGGDLALGIARGDETFAPLFKPHIVEHPEPGELIYYTPQSRRVMCRRWTWRNADFSKITPDTSAIAMNVDLLHPVFPEHDLRPLLADVVGLLRRFAYGEIETYVLDPDRRSIRIDPVFLEVSTVTS